MYRSVVSEFYSVQEFCKGSVYGAFLLLPENYIIEIQWEYAVYVVFLALTSSVSELVCGQYET